MTNLSIAHIINPVIVNPDSDLYSAQPITFETMRAAKAFSKKELEVKQFAAFFPGDERLVEDGFEKTRVLDRSVLDLKTFKVKRRLPLIKDILDRLYEKSKAEYFIYTNVDIALMPHFYLTVRKIIEQGYDGFVIYRRTLSGNYSSISQLPLMYADYGEQHPGHDCFVFRRSSYKNYILGNACIGARKIARVLMSNIIAFSYKYKEFPNLHMTFHIGDKRIWSNSESNEYYYYNVSELMKISKELLNNKRVINRKRLIDFFKFNIDQIMTTKHNYPETEYLKEIPLKTNG